MEERPGYGVRHCPAVPFVNSQAPPRCGVTSAMGSVGNDSVEVVLQDWVKRARSSQRDGARLLARFLREAKREQGNVQRSAREALVSAAGILRSEVDQIQRGLTVVSRRLAAFEQEQKKAPPRSRATTPKSRARRTTTQKRRRTLKKAA